MRPRRLGCDPRENEDLSFRHRLARLHGKTPEIVMADPPKKYVLPLQFSASPRGTRNLPSPHELYSQMQAKIAELEKALAELPARPAGMGHNQPPESIDIDPADIQELGQAIQVLKAQPESPADKGKVALETLQTIEAKASKFRAWAERRGEEFASEATKAAGKQTGTWLSVTAVGVLVDHLLGLSTVVRLWLEALLR
jgi:hypothetical protein